jgi:RNA polymerase-binding protein DksA
MTQVLDPKILKKIETQLLAEKKQIREDLAGLSHKDPHEADNRTTSFPEYGDKPDENAQEISDYSANIVTESVLEKSLNDITKALDRIKSGTYGVCKYCGKPIAEKRLLARPTANSCVNCKTELQENE